MVFKDRLKELRLESGVSQRKCAESIGVAYANYNKWENGTEPNFMMLLRVAEYYGTTTDYLLGRTDTRYATKVDADKAVRVLQAENDSMRLAIASALKCLNA